MFTLQPNGVIVCNLLGMWSRKQLLELPLRISKTNLSAERQQDVMKERTLNHEDVLAGSDLPCMPTDTFHDLMRVPEPKSTSTSRGKVFLVGCGPGHPGDCYTNSFIK